GTVVTAAGYALAVFALVDMLRHRRSPAVTTAWLLTLIFLPFLGVVLYFLFGGVRLRRERRRKLKSGFAAYAKFQGSSPDEPESPLAATLKQLLANYSLPDARKGNRF